MGCVWCVLGLAVFGVFWVCAVDVLCVCCVELCLGHAWLVLGACMLHVWCVFVVCLVMCWCMFVACLGHGFVLCVVWCVLGMGFVFVCSVVVVCWLCVIWWCVIIFVCVIVCLLCVV